MPRLIAAIDDTVDVEYGQFALQELPMTRNALTSPSPPSPGRPSAAPGA